jgi:hypothetical protein
MTAPDSLSCSLLFCQASVQHGLVRLTWSFLSAVVLERHPPVEVRTQRQQPLCRYDGYTCVMVTRACVTIRSQVFCAGILLCRLGTKRQSGMAGCQHAGHRALSIVHADLGHCRL